MEPDQGKRLLLRSASSVSLKVSLSPGTKMSVPIIVSLPSGQNNLIEWNVLNHYVVDIFYLDWPIRNQGQLYMSSGYFRVLSRRFIAAN